MRWMFAAIALAASMRAEIFLPAVEVQAVDHFFNVTADPEFPNYGGETFRFSPAPFTVDLAVDSEIAYTLRAPAGHKFRVGPSGGYLYLEMSFGVASSGSSPAQIRMSLENATGPTPGFGEATMVFIPNAIRTFSSVVGNGNDFIRFGGAAPSFRGPLEFTGIIFHVNYGAREAGSGPHTFNYSGGGLNTYFFSNSNTDPGPIVRLAPIPEPSAGRLLAICCLYAALATRMNKKARPKSGLRC